MTSHPKRRKLSQPASFRASSFFSIPLTRSHPYNVQPLGNLYLSPDPYNCIPPGLGSLLRLFPEPAFLPFLHHFTAADLGLLSSLSKALYVYCHDDDLFKALVLSRWPSSFHFHSTWRLTCIRHHILSTRGLPAAQAELARQRLLPPPSIRGFYSDLLFQSFYCSALDLSHFRNADNVPRVHVDDLTPERWLRDYAVPNRPCVITGLVERWPAARWTLDSLAAEYGSTPFKCGAHTLPLSAYAAYARQTTDEAPLYLFDSQFGEKYPAMAAAYEPPSCFARDLFALLQHLPAPPGYNDGCEDRETPAGHMQEGRGRGGGMRPGVEEDEKRDAGQGAFGSMRPAYRWVLIGPARSGSTFHKVSSSCTHSHRMRRAMRCRPSIRSNARLVLCCLRMVRQWRCVQPGRARSAPDRGGHR